MYSQKNKTPLYIDENAQLISMIDYYEKCNSFLFKCSKREQDSLLINSTHQLFKFGKLTTKENSQLRNFLKAKTSDINFLNKAIVINHIEVLKGYDEAVKFIKTDTLHRSNYFNEKIYNKINKNLDLYKKKCSKKVHKLNANVVNTYSSNNKYIFVPKYYKWIKAKFLSNVFFNKKNGIIVLKPNGEYFLNQGYINNDYIKILLSDDNWDNYKKEYQVALNNLAKKRTNFFKNKKFKNKSVVFLEGANFKNRNQIKQRLRKMGKSISVFRGNKSQYLNRMRTKIWGECYSRSQ